MKPIATLIIAALCTACAPSAQQNTGILGGVSAHHGLSGIEIFSTIKGSGGTR